MNLEQISGHPMDEKDVLLKTLREVIPDYGYSQKFYTELQHFLFKTPHALFNAQKRPAFIRNLLQDLSAEDTDNLLTVLEGVKALILEHQLDNLMAYNRFMQTNKRNRFMSRV